jgi:hypothetical protein
MKFCGVGAKRRAVCEGKISRFLQATGGPLLRPVGLQQHGHTCRPRMYAVLDILPGCRLPRPWPGGETTATVARCRAAAPGTLHT